MAQRQESGQDILSIVVEKVVSSLNLLCFSLKNEPKPCISQMVPANLCIHKGVFPKFFRKHLIPMDR